MQNCSISQVLGEDLCGLQTTLMLCQSYPLAAYNANIPSYINNVTITLACTSLMLVDCPACFCGLAQLLVSFLFSFCSGIVEFS